MLSRRFRGYTSEYFLRGSVGGAGVVGSPLRPDRLHEISDDAWLQIVSNERIPPRGIPKWKRIASDRFAESSVEHFACDLGSAAKRFPERFARLALRFPANVHSSYVAAILDGIKATKPDNVPDEEKASWKPAEPRTVESVFEKCNLGDDRSVARNFCWLVRVRADEEWSDKTMSHILNYAMKHADPEPEKLRVRCDRPSSEATVEDLVQNAINCVRGVAGSAIGALLWGHPERLEKLKAGIEHMVSDAHPAVRVAGLEACLPLLNNNRDLAVDLFLQACKDDLRVAASRYAVYYFNCGMQNYADRLAPIIIQMFNSTLDEVAAKGAQEVCARWLFYGYFDKELHEGLVGSVSHRKGIAEVAAHLMADDKHAEKSKDLLLALFKDENKDVRRKASHVIWNKPELLDRPGIESFLLDFIRSKAFQDDPTGLLITFEKYPGSLLPFAELVFAVCEQFACPLAELSRDISMGLSHDASKIPSLLLRLYEQTERTQPGIAQKCLDAWDILFEHRIGRTREIAKAMEI